MARNKPIIQLIKTNLGFIFVAVVILISAKTSSLMAQNRLIKEQSEIEIRPTPTSLPTNTPTPTKKPVDRVVKSKVDTDPPVHCQISVYCGGTRPLRKSECDNLTCCPTADGFKLLTLTECASKKISAPLGSTYKQDTNNQKYNYTLPTLKPLPTFAPIATLQPLPTFVPIATNTPPNPTTDPELISACIQVAQQELNQALEVCNTNPPEAGMYGWNVGVVMCETSARDTFEAVKIYCRNL